MTHEGQSAQRAPPQVANQSHRLAKSDKCPLRRWIEVITFIVLIGDRLRDVKVSYRFCVLALFAIAVPFMWACLTAYPAAHPVTLIDEKAIIVWNADQKRQHFIRQATFDGDAEHFGFIVPVPTHPEVAEVDVSAFDLLESLVPAPEDLATGSTEETDSVAASVDVIEQYTVGDYEVSILKSKDGKSMLAWLEENDYESRPAMEDWLDHYADMSWIFAALKFIREEGSTEPKTEALRISFDTDVPHYPYKMPTDTWPQGHYRPMALYFIGGGYARAQYRGDSSDWEAEIAWSGQLPLDKYELLADQLGLELTDLPYNATVTVFHNTENAQGYDKDLFFLEYNSILPTWAVMLLAGATVVFIIVVVKGRKRNTESAA